MISNDEDVVIRGRSPWDLQRELFAFLARERVRYVVLGDYVKARDERDGDLDVALSDAELRRLPLLLVRFANRMDARLVQCIRHESSSWFFVLAWQDDQFATHVLQIDACSDYRRNGRLLLSSSELLSGRLIELVEGVPVYVPAPEVGLAYYLVKKVEKRELTPGHARHLQYLARRSHADRLTGKLAGLFGPERAAVLAGALRRGDHFELNQRLMTMHQALHARRRHSAASRALEIGRIVTRLLVPTGFFVVVLGPDGAGKSTVIAALRDQLSGAFWGTDYFHLRPRLGSRTAPGTATPVEDPHGLAPRGALPSVLKLLYYAFDYIAGYATTVKPRLLRSRLVVFDRYYQDILVDPRRYRYGGPRWVVRLVAKLIPPPDLFLFLDAPASVVQERKNEVSFAETNRQTEAYRTLAASMRRGVVIDASASGPGVAAEVVDAVLDGLADRLERRLGLR